MKRYIEEDEVALILKPASFDEQGWTGELSTGLLVGELKNLHMEDAGVPCSFSYAYGCVLTQSTA